MVFIHIIYKSDEGLTIEKGKKCLNETYSLIIATSLHQFETISRITATTSLTTETKPEKANPEKAQTYYCMLG